MAAGGNALTATWFYTGAMGEPRRYAFALPDLDWAALGSARSGRRWL